MTLFIYSGECRQCACGEDTGFTDMHGKPLYTGDIVISFTVRGNGDDMDYFPDSLSAVVSDAYQTYRGPNGRFHEKKDGDPEYFVMGIKSVDMDAPTQWRVIKLKDRKDVIDGEHWAAWGFNYREESA